MAGKLDVVYDQYWSIGIDTTGVPKSVLSPYTEQDIRCTWEIFQKQRAQFNPLQAQNFWLDCQDLLVLLDMEEAGMVYDIQEAANRGAKVGQEMAEITLRMNELVEAPFEINWGSPLQVSAILYGGDIDYAVREQYIRVLKDGREKEKERWAKRTHRFPQLVKPFKDETSTAEPILKRLKATGTAAKLIRCLLERQRLKKLNTTYYEGLVDKYKEMEWSGNVLHGNFNQCAAVTGRLSSSGPNFQNFDGSIKELFYSRYENGVLINADWKGLEWVAAVYLSGDDVGRREIVDGIDQHSENQRWLGFGGAPDGRLLAKKFVFRLIYGGSAYAYANDADFSSVKLSEREWQGVIDRFYEKYWRLGEWHDWLVEEVMRYGKLTIPSGRCYTFSRDLNGNLPRTQILNYPVQGFGAELMKLARLIYAQKLKTLALPNTLLVSTVHDSLLTDTTNGSNTQSVTAALFETWDEVPALFYKSYKRELDIPIRVEVSAGPNWKEQKEILRV